MVKYKILELVEYEEDGKLGFEEVILEAADIEKIVPDGELLLIHHSLGIVYKAKELTICK